MSATGRRRVWIWILAVGLALALIGYAWREPESSRVPRMEIRVVGWTQLVATAPALVLVLSNPGPWILHRHVPYELNVEGLGSREEVLPQASGLLPRTEERVLLPGPTYASPTQRWSATFRFTAQRLPWSERLGRWWLWLPGAGRTGPNRNLPPGSYRPGTATTPWFTSAPPAAPIGVPPRGP